MIVAVALNAALDITYELEQIAWLETNRVPHVRRRAGGKAVNVARVLHALGEETVVTGFAGGADGAAIQADLAASGIADALEPIAGESRRTLAVVATAPGDVTLFNEPGPSIAAGDWDRFRGRFETLLGEARAVVLAGSLPAALAHDAYAMLISAAAARGVRVVLDAEGAALRAGIAAGPAVVKPNEAELAGLAQQPLDTTASIAAAAEALRAAGAKTVVVSRGPDGLLACTPRGHWQAAPPEFVTGNPTGAGDAAVAALTRGLLAGTPWPDRLADAVALSAAAVRSPLAGSFDAHAYRLYRDQVRVKDLGDPRTVEGPQPSGGTRADP